MMSGRSTETLSVLALCCAVLMLPAAGQDWLIYAPTGRKCPTNRPVSGFCPIDECPNTAPYNCSTTQTLAPTGVKSSLCGTYYGPSVVCPDNQIVAGVCFSNSTYRCNSTEYPDDGCDMIVSCVEGTVPEVHKDTCEWRWGGAAPKGLNCHDDELVSGLSSGSSLNVYCCYSGRTNERCSPTPYWIKQSSTACLPDTAVAALCSYNCDPTGAIDAKDTRANVSVMTFCQGTFFTNVYTRRLTQCSTGFVSCNEDEMMLGVHPCTSRRRACARPAGTCGTRR
jgi:hypothetical protein